MGNRSNLKRLTGKFTRFDNRKKFAKEVFKNKKAGEHLGGAVGVLFIVKRMRMGIKNIIMGRYFNNILKVKFFAEFVIKKEKLVVI